MVLRASTPNAEPQKRRMSPLSSSRVGRSLVAGLVVAAVCATTLAYANRSSAATAPAFVQQVTGHAGSVTSLAVTPASALGSGNRLVVEVGVWSSSGATAKSVTDSAGDGFVELTHFTASDNTEMSVWSAPVTAGAGARPAVTVTPSSKADVGVAALEYSGLSTVADNSVVDQQKTASGTTGSAATVTSGSTSATGAANELALGLYADSGFGDTLAGGSGYSVRSNVSPTGDVEFLAEDQVVAAGATPSASVHTGASTVWLMATIVLKSGATTPPTLPGAPSNVVAAAGNASALVSWVAPSNGGSAITSYIVTPYLGSAAQPAVTVGGSPPPTSVSVNGLANGSSYTFTVAATNKVGTGPASTPSNAVIPSAVGPGQWSSLMSWPIVAVHSVLLPNGKFVLWDGWQQPEPTYVWNPTTQVFESTINAPDSIFCSGTAELPDGRVLVIGGYGALTTGQVGIVDTNIFDPATSTWTRVADMHEPRWYPTVTELPDGRYVAISGQAGSTTYSNNPEIYDPVKNTWTLLSSISTAQVQEPEYPFSYLLPNGNVYTMAPSVDESFELNVSAPSWAQVNSSSGILNGSSVMYRPGHILYSGGAPSENTTTNAQSTAATIDLTANNPTWQPTTPMNYARVYHTLTMLADGNVLAVGGEATSSQTNVTTGVLPAEIWDPSTGTWTTVASMSAARNYHSTAVLMPDGTVLVAGGGHEESSSDPGQFSAQIYSPPYLSNGPRPTITSIPSQAGYGSSISVGTPDAASISAVNLVSLGADTHQIDMDQHFVPLSFTTGTGGLNVQLPSSAAVAPPGNYMLFILNKNGVPSIAPILNLGPAANATVPGAATGVVALPGNGSATVNWTAPASGDSPISSYRVTPYIGSVAQPAVAVTGAPPATSVTVGGLENGTSYTFTVTATNAVGTGPSSAPSNAVTPAGVSPPAFVQQVSKHASSVSSLAVTPSTALGSGNRLVVEVGVWSSSGATAKSVTDSAGDGFVELTHFTASDNTEMSVWSAPVTAGAGARPAVTVTPSSKADVGVAALEYSGLSTVADNSVVDQQKTASGTTGSAATVTSGSTSATGAANELALGLYADSGFGDTLAGGSGYSVRSNVSPTGDVEFLAEDQVVAAGAMPSASVHTGASTVWLMATIVLKTG